VSFEIENNQNNSFFSPRDCAAVLSRRAVARRTQREVVSDKLFPIKILSIPLTKRREM
jgi:hypothetical protein